MRKFKTQLRNLGRHIREGTREAVAGLRAAPAETKEMLSVKASDVPAADRAMFGGLTVAMYLVAVPVAGTVVFLVLAAIL